jgi:hypothetical protein
MGRPQPATPPPTHHPHHPVIARGKLTRQSLRVGTHLPWVITVGTFWTRKKKIFAVVHRRTPRGLRVVLDGARHDEWIVGCTDPEAVKAELSLP